MDDKMLYEYAYCIDKLWARVHNTSPSTHTHSHTHTRIDFYVIIAHCVPCIAHSPVFITKIFHVSIDTTIHYSVFTGKISIN